MFVLHDSTCQKKQGKIVYSNQSKKLCIIKLSILNIQVKKILKIGHFSIKHEYQEKIFIRWKYMNKIYFY